MMLLTGCWDQVEINERAYVITLGLDINEEEEEGLNVTYTFPNLPAITGNGEGRQSYSKSIPAPTLYEANKLFGTRSRRQLTFDHSKIIIFGEEVLKDPRKIKDLLDQFERDPHFARTLIVLATEGKASDVIEEELYDESDIGFYITKLFDNNQRDVLQTTRVTLDDFLINVNENTGSLLIPRVVVEEEEPKIEGVAILINSELVDWLEREDIEKMSWVMGKGIGTTLKVPLDDEEVTIEITEMDTKITFEDRGNKAHLKIRLISKANIMAYTLNPNVSLFEDETLLKIEASIDEVLKEETTNMIKRVQTEYGADIFNIVDRLAVNNRSLWMKWNENWDEIFSEASFEIESETNIRRIGVSK
jgi:Ger(x)C family germination protein